MPPLISIQNLGMKCCRKGYLEHPRHEGNGVKINKKSMNSLTRFFSHHSPPPMSGTVFFSEHQNGKHSRYPFLKLFRTRVLDTQ